MTMISHTKHELQHKGKSIVLIIAKPFGG